MLLHWKVKKKKQFFTPSASPSLLRRIDRRAEPMPATYGAINSSPAQVYTQKKEKKKQPIFRLDDAQYTLHCASRKGLLTFAPSKPKKKHNYLLFSRSCLSLLTIWARMYTYNNYTVFVLGAMALIFAVFSLSLSLFHTPMLRASSESNKPPWYIVEAF